MQPAPPGISRPTRLVLCGGLALMLGASIAAVLGQGWLALGLLLTPVILPLLALFAYGVLALVAFSWGRINRMRHPRHAHRRLSHQPHSTRLHRAA